jgi:hypothetical protein
MRPRENSRYFRTVFAALFSWSGRISGTKDETRD